MTALDIDTWRTFLYYTFRAFKLHLSDMHKEESFGNTENAEEDLLFYDQDWRGGIQVFPGSEFDEIF